MMKNQSYSKEKSLQIQLKNIFSKVLYMSRKGPEVGKGMLDFVEDLSLDVVSH